MEMGIAAREIHDNGSMKQLKTGSSTGMNPAAVRDSVDFIDEEMTEKTGIETHTPWDVRAPTSFCCTMREKFWHGREPRSLRGDS